MILSGRVDDAGEFPESLSVSVLVVLHVLTAPCERSPNGGPGLRVGASRISGGAGLPHSDSRTPPRRESRRKRVRPNPEPDRHAVPR